jgi:glutathione-specific gamma-glutamylcyclotransferase
MWVFGYGSLMWDGWESRFGGSRSDGAVLSGYRRSFNKKSVTNWGTSEEPGPTLGLEPDETAECIGTAFEFPDTARVAVEEELKKREGPSFALPRLPVRLRDGREIRALTPVNDRTKTTYLGRVPLNDRAAMAKTAKGESGSCADYVRNISKKLGELGIADKEVATFLSSIESA